MRYLLIGILFFCCPAFAQSENESDLEYIETDIIERLSELHKKLNASGTQDLKCLELPDKKCSQNDLCKAYLGKTRELYFGKNSVGEALPNTFLMSLRHQIYSCGGAMSPPKFDKPSFHDIHMLGKEDVAKIAPLYEKKKKQLSLMFQEVQKDIIELLQARKTGSVLGDKELDAQIQRIKMASLRQPKIEDLGELFEAGCEAPNAFYDRSRHTVSFCPQILDMPEASLYAVMSHELGHAIDPCVASLALKKNSEGRIFADSEGFLGPKHSGNLLVAPSKKGAYAFEDVMKCLSSAESMNISMANDKQRTLDEIQRLISEAQEDGAEEQYLEPLREQRLDAEKLYNEYPYCAEPGNGRQLSEAFSDWMSAKLVAKKVARIKDPQRKREFVAESVSHFTTSDCPELKAGVAQFYMDELGDKGLSRCPSLRQLTDPEFHQQQEQLEEESTHPSSRKRIDRIYFADPQIRKVMGCHDSSEKSAKDCR